MDSGTTQGGVRKQQLSLAARPRRLDSLIGQKKAVVGIQRQLANERKPKGWLLSGPRGCGKTSAARLLAISYQCEHQEVAGAPCKECMRLAHYPNLDGCVFPIHEIPGANISTLDKMRAALSGVHAGVMGIGTYRVYIINECQRCSSASMDLFLEYLEDTPPSTVFIFTTTEPWEVSDPVQSRCQCFSFRELDISEIEVLVARLLKRVASNLPADRLVEALSDRRVKSPRSICQAVERYVSGADPEEAAEVTAAEEIDISALTRAVVKGEWPDASRYLIDAQNSDVRALRRALISYLRAVLLESSEIGPRADAVEKAITTLADVQNADSAVISAVISAKIYRLCACFAKYRL